MQKMITIRSGEHNLSGALHLPEYRKEAIPLLDICSWVCRQ